MCANSVAESATATSDHLHNSESDDSETDVQSVVEVEQNSNDTTCFNTLQHLSLLSNADEVRNRGTPITDDSVDDLSTQAESRDDLASWPETKRQHVRDHLKIGKEGLSKSEKGTVVSKSHCKRLLAKRRSCRSTMAITFCIQ